MTKLPSNDLAVYPYGVVSPNLKQATGAEDRPAYPKQTDEGSMKTLRKIALFAILGIVGIVNIRLYHNGDSMRVDRDTYSSFDRSVVMQLSYLRARINDGMAEDMQSVYPEGFYFSHVLYGLAWAAIGRQVATDSPLWHEALREARFALKNLDMPAAKAPFPMKLQPPYGAFYHSWKNWLRGCVLLMQPPAIRKQVEIERFVRDCRLFAEALRGSDTPHLQSYTQMAWPCDGLIGVAALNLHDKILEPRFAGDVKRWLQATQKTLDPHTGLIPHMVHPLSGEALEGARGCSQSLMLRFLAEIDPEFALAQYRLYLEHFATELMGMPCIREYPHGTEGSGDIDSGPVILGVGSAATIVSLAAARCLGDSARALAYRQSFEALGFPMTFNNRKRYAFGAMAIGDAFLAWCKLTKAVVYNYRSREFSASPAWWWRLPVHGLSLILILLIFVPRILRQRQRRLKTALTNHSSP